MIVIGALAKIELKKMCGGGNKNTKGSAMSVGLLVVRLKYGLYVGRIQNGLSLIIHLCF